MQHLKVNEYHYWYINSINTATVGVEVWWFSVSKLVPKIKFMASLLCRPHSQCMRDTFPIHFSRKHASGKSVGSFHALLQEACFQHLFYSQPCNVPETRFLQKCLNFSHKIFAGTINLNTTVSIGNICRELENFLYMSTSAGKFPTRA